MSIQPVLTPAQQTVRDLIQAWRDESGIPVSQPDCHGFGAPAGSMGVRKTAPEQRGNAVEGLTKTTNSEESKWL